MRGAVLITSLAWATGCGAWDRPPADVSVCDPIRATGCVSPLRCVANDHDPLFGRCAPDGAASEGRACDESRDCARELQCIRDRCLRPCISDHDCPRPGSRCSVSANSVQWSACTIPGLCDDRDAGSCDAPLVCRPTSPLAIGMCLAAGTGGDGAPCADPTDCDARHTCFIKGNVGRCRPTCSPTGTDCAAPRLCATFIDRPDDYGACTP